MLKISIPKIALRNHAQTVSGSRGSVIPSVRKSIVVTVKLSAVHNEAAQKTATLASQSEIPDCISIRNATVMPKRETAVAQKQRRFSAGNAIFHAPICSGRR
jgi:hypothetical protein